MLFLHGILALRPARPLCQHQHECKQQQQLGGSGPQSAVDAWWPLELQAGPAPVGDAHIGCSQGLLVDAGCGWPGPSSVPVSAVQTSR